MIAIVFILFTSLAVEANTQAEYIGDISEEYISEESQWPAIMDIAIPVTYIN